MLKRDQAHQLANLLQLLMTSIEMIEKGSDSKVVRHEEIERSKDYVRKITDFVNANTDPPASK